MYVNKILVHIYIHIYMHYTVESYLYREYTYICIYINLIPIPFLYSSVDKNPYLGYSKQRSSKHRYLCGADLDS